MKKKVSIFLTFWYVWILAIILLWLIVGRKIINFIKVKMSVIEHNNTNVPNNNTTLSPVNLQDIAAEIYDSLTNFGFLIYGGLFTDGAKVVILMLQVPKTFIKQLATIYANNHSRDLYADLRDGLTEIEYSNIKQLLS